jgi:hypothetical protein
MALALGGSVRPTEPPLRMASLRTQRPSTFNVLFVAAASKPTGDGNIPVI